MLHILYWLIVLLAVGTSSSTSAENNLHRRLGSAEKRLTKRLLENYAEWGIVGRPVKNSTDVLTVRLGLALIQILDLEENQQRLRTNCWLRFTWKDTLLAWDHWQDEEFKAIKQIRVRPSQIWTPDIKLYNFADERMKEKREARVVVQRDGEILWIPQALLKSTCKVRLLNFPFDTQHCRMNFGSWTYDDSRLMLDWSLTDIRINDTHLESKPLPFVDYNDYVKSNEWVTDGEFELDVADPDQRRGQIRSVVSYRNETGFDSNGQPVRRRYRILEFKIRMMRNPSFYVAILVVPCILLSLLTLVIFWLPPESPAKMLLGMNIFVAFFILLLLLAELIPSAVEAFPLIGCYYCVNMGLITFSTFVAVLIVNLHFHGDKSGPVPSIVKRIMIEGLGRLFMVQRSIPLPLDRRVFLSRDSSEDFLPQQLQQNRLHPRQYLSLPSNPAAARRAAVHSQRRRLGVGRPSVRRHSPQSRRLRLAGPPEVENDLKEISRFIRLFLGRKRDTEARNLLALEWRTLAQVLDRLFFVLYIVLLTSFLLLFIPRRKENVQTFIDDD